MAGPIPTSHWPVFDSLGESQVRMQFAEASGDIGIQAKEWLLLKEHERSAAAASKRDAREEETLSIARKAIAASDRANEIAELANTDAEKARSIARRANTIAITAAAFATAATIIAAVIGVIYASQK